MADTSALKADIAIDTAVMKAKLRIAKILEALPDDASRARVIEAVAALKQA